MRGTPGAPPALESKHQTLPGLNISPLPLRFNHMLSRRPLSPPTVLFPGYCNECTSPLGYPPNGHPLQARVRI